MDISGINCRGETASGRSREARARQIARAEEPQAQDARATKQARPETKKQGGTRVKNTVKLKLQVKASESYSLSLRSAGLTRAAIS